MLILIVDDEIAIAETLAEWASGLGYSAQVASNGQEALRLARQRWPVLVITDLMMPQMDGNQLIAAFRAEARTRKGAMPRTLLLTAADSEAAHSAGADAVVLKPFDLDQLEPVVRRLVTRPPR